MLIHTHLPDIRYGRPDASDEEVMAAAKEALIHDTIMEFPNGYNTVVGDRGAGLSGGQKQRVAIARVFLMDARIVLMDEPTSALDTANEALVAQAVQRLYQGRTCLVVTHTSDLLRAADSVLVMAGGSCEAHGTIPELRASSVSFQRLFPSV